MDREELVRLQADVGRGGLDAAEAVRSLVDLALESGDVGAAGEESAFLAADRSTAVAGLEPAAQMVGSWIAAAGFPHVPAILVVPVQTLDAELVFRFASGLVDFAVAVDVETPLEGLQGMLSVGVLRLGADVPVALGLVGTRELPAASALVTAVFADLCLGPSDDRVVTGLSAAHSVH